MFCVFNVFLWYFIVFLGTILKGGTVSSTPFLPSKIIPNLLNHLSDTFQKPFQQIPSIHHKLFHEIICLIQCFPKFRVFRFQLLILTHNIYKFISQGLITTGTSCHIINHLRNFCFSLQLRCLMQIILMLLYYGVRISEFLDLKKKNVHLDEQYFDVISSKTENGIRKVPIVDKVLPFYKAWFEDNPECAYLIHTPDGKHFQYRNYYDSYFHPLMEQLKIDRIPHCCRHTCISMLAEAGVDQTIIKKIVGHSGAMTLTEKVYTHFDIKELVDAINKI